ncbi:hypothetical protein C3747_104g76 [Trypanosoma cruzi]|uniref:Uncharacterized protein n=1 Tax=Trypanosoma cruzi TaxID=5693 RepID=A0A2V2WF42_TRYCR|nr:hypothetical protein C3747_104g76 [Trypanosoma cruzi]RNC47186.1 hypothetical protein TcCL_NonESM02932 [Trypanosoma cruzi]
MGAPKVVYSALIRNTTTIPVTVLVDYTMPNELPQETVELLIQPGEEVVAPEKLVEEETVTWTGFINKVSIQGGQSMSAPFPGVECPTRRYDFEVFMQAGALRLFALGPAESSSG